MKQWPIYLGIALATALVLAQFWMTPEQSRIVDTVIGVVAAVLFAFVGATLIFAWFRLRRRWGRDWRKVIKQKSDI
jgi:hypothetical protein